MSPSPDPLLRTADAPRPPSRAPATRWVAPAIIGATFLVLAAVNLWRGMRPSDLTTEDARFGRLLLDPRTERWVFKDPTTGDALGLAIRDADSKRAWLSLKGLPEAGAGRGYVLWTRAHGEGRPPENRGAVEVRRDRRIDLELPVSIDLRDVAELAISLEADPATPAPSEGALKARAASPRP